MTKKTKNRKEVVFKTQINVGNTDEFYPNFRLGCHFCKTCSHKAINFLMHKYPGKSLWLSEPYQGAIEDGYKCDICNKHFTNFYGPHRYHLTAKQIKQFNKEYGIGE